MAWLIVFLGFVVWISTPIISDGILGVDPYYWSAAKDFSLTNLWAQPAPVCWRVAGPALASLWPWGPMGGFQIINLVGSLLGLWVITKWVSEYNKAYVGLIVVYLCLPFSFARHLAWAPVLPDGAYAGLAVLSMYLIHKDKWRPAMVAALTATAFKETGLAFVIIVMLRKFEVLYIWALVWGVGTALVFSILSHRAMFCGGVLDVWLFRYIWTGGFIGSLWLAYGPLAFIWVGSNKQEILTMFWNRPILWAWFCFLPMAFVGGTTAERYLLAFPVLLIIGSRLRMNGYQIALVLATQVFMALPCWLPTSRYLPDPVVFLQVWGGNLVQHYAAGLAWQSRIFLSAQVVVWCLVYRALRTRSGVK